ncbi:hypothetical protein CDAR_618991 [Caerostris darwini]|uniref:Uncharacterized protein n=1 Tax=Caerostris darwini TaxID=1538125 RepID=A0AAV4VDD2_9ARAC|nr:hypothetical protein CDAR_618991 [Caerostris darwini]
METKCEYYASVKHFAYALFVYYRGEDEAYKAILDWLDYEECLTLIRVGKTLMKMDDIYGKIFRCYLEKWKEDRVLHSKKDFAKFLIERSSHFCRSPSFFNFLLVCLFMCHLLKSQPQCLLLIQVVAKCLMMVFKERYDNFFKANGGLIGMRKYFDQIKHEDMRYFIYRHANSKNKKTSQFPFSDSTKVSASSAFIVSASSYHDVLHGLLLVITSITNHYYRCLHMIARFFKYFGECFLEILYP